MSNGSGSTESRATSSTSAGLRERARLALLDNLAAAAWAATAVPGARVPPCESAIGPNAYLAALVRYATENLRDGTEPVTPQWLQASFCQPFGALELNCAASEDEVNQTRVVIEVLRTYLKGNDPGPDPGYVRDSYSALLLGIGSSDAELRLVRHGDEASRESLATRLGIDVTHLNALLLLGGDLTEASLFKLFGLLPTVGPTPPAAEPDLLAWQLQRLGQAWALADHPKEAPPDLPPVIDPDVITAEFFAHPDRGNAAFDLWEARRSWVTGKMKALDAERKNPSGELAGFNAVTTTVLGTDGAGLNDLAGKRAKGEDIDPDIAKLGLVPDEFNYLITMYRILAGQAGLLDTEWTSVCSILTQVLKRREFKSWRSDEAAKQIILAPGWFRFPDTAAATFPPPPAPPLPAWRATVQVRSAWESTLRSRTDQAGQLRQALASVVAATEVDTLPGLRDWLLLKLPADAGPDLAAKADWFARNFQVDTTIAGSQLTTRVGQAIETLQGVLWAVRTRQLTSTRPTLALRDQVAFDDAWPWIGGFATWRAQQLVALYPEDFMQTGLRRDQTPAFGKLVDATRDRPSLTPSQARSVAGNFGASFEDTCRLSPGAACLARTRTGPDGDPHGSFRDLYYTFAVSPLSGRPSWGCYDAAGPTGWKDSAWEAIPGLGQVLSFIGAMPYEASKTRRWIVLAALVGGPPGGRAVLTRYDLEARRWDELPADITLPAGGVAAGLALAQPTEGGAAQDPPALFAAAGGKVRRASLKADATGIDADGWQDVETPKDMTAAAVRAAFVTAKAGSWQLVTEKQPGGLQVVTKGATAPTDVAGRFIGTVNFPGDNCYFVYRMNIRGPDWKVKYAELDNPGTATDFPVDIRGLAMVTGLPKKQTVLTSWLEQSTPWRAELTNANSLLEVTSKTPLSPVITGPFTFTDTYNEGGLAARRAAIQAGYAANASAPCSVINVLDEAYCYAPVHLAGQLQAAGQYIAALDWLRTVFDDTVPWKQASPFSGVFCPANTAIGQWLADPLDAFALAQTRGDPRLIFALKSTISCLLGYGDSEFSRDTAESVPRARALYLEAIRLVAILRAVRQDGRFPVGLPSGLTHDGGSTLSELLATAQSWRQRTHDHLAALDGVAEALEATASAAGQVAVDRWFGPLTGLPGFVVPPDGAADALEQHAQVNLYKISNGCNMAGMVRQLDPYAVPTDAGSGLPVIGGKTQLWLPAANPQAPTPYRYGVVIERAKQLAGLATQLETALLSALEKRDAEYYTLMRARQDLGLAQAGVQLADLRVREAQDHVTLAQLGQQRAESQVSYYGNLLDQGVSGLEKDALILMGVSAGLEAAAGAANFLAAALPASVSAGFPSGVSISTSPQSSAMAVAAGLSSLAAAANTTGSILSTVASYERRKQEWEQQKNLAQRDTAIAAAQVVTAQDNVRIVGQDRNIASLQADFAATNVEYLANKFTNVALYEWMSQVLEGVYRSLLQQATSIAQVAAAQLAFERQETPPVVIKSDYWQMPPGGLSSSATGGAGVDRKGLTGSYRLLDDITRLDQYAFATAQRKLQLAKTISLARLAPAEFQRLRQSGVMEFATPAALFDLDFPGHYLRLISRVRTSVIALVPATDAIKATLTTTGTSRVMVSSDDVFRPVVVKRVPEQVALTSPRDATGLFELSPVTTTEMLLPFEGSGVDTNWRFELPRPSNLFDFTTLADVLLTIEYTALASDVYRVQVVRQLDRATSADRPFSFRSQFPDQWYDLHNPATPSGPFTVRFATGDANFPPNLSGLVMTELAMLFARGDAAVGEVRVDSLKFTPHGETDSYGGGAASIDGVISTRRGNATAWVPITGHEPTGTWELTFPETARALFSSGGITDVVFDITYRYQVAAWPDDSRR